MRALWTLLIVATACGDGDTTIPPRVEVEFEVSKDRIGFGEVALGELETVFLSVDNRTRSDVELTGVIEGPAAFTVTSPQLPMPILADDAVTLTLQYLPTEPGDFEAVLALSTAKNALDVVLMGSAQAPAVELGSLELALPLGEGLVAGTSPITVRNSGAGDLVVTAVTVPEGEPYFALAEPIEGFTLAMNTARDVVITWDVPVDAVGEFTGRLEVVSNDLDAPVISAGLRALVTESGDTSADSGGSYGPVDTGAVSTTTPALETGDTGVVDSAVSGT
jgi:hypothetical protein